MPVRFNSKVVIEQFDFLRWSERLDRKMREIVREGAKRFLWAVIARIQVDTGFLRGSFLNLEYLLGSATGKLEHVKSRHGRLYSRLRRDKKSASVTAMNKIKRLSMKITKIKEKMSGFEGGKRYFYNRKKEYKELITQLKQDRAAIREARRQYKAGQLSPKERAKYEQARRKRYFRELLKAKTLKQLNIIASRTLEKKITPIKRAEARNARIARNYSHLIKRLNYYTQRLAELHNIKYSGGTRGLKSAIAEQFPELSEKTIFYNFGKGKLSRTNFRDQRTARLDRFDKYYYPIVGGKTRIRKTPEAGRRFGTPIKDIFNFSGGRVITVTGRAASAATRPTYIFNFATLVRYLEINDRKEGWHSWQAGRAAFNLYVKTAMEREMKNFSEFLLVTSSTHGHEKSVEEFKANYQAKHGRVNVKNYRITPKGREYQTRNDVFDVRF